ncbi:MAG: HU family DNA-binding protein [Patescibacteria group bacterium]
MNRAELIKELARKTDVEEKQAAEFVGAFLETMSDYFKKGEKVVIGEFGSFFVTPNRQIQFNPSAKLKQLVE